MSSRAPVSSSLGAIASAALAAARASRSAWRSRSRSTISWVCSPSAGATASMPATSASRSARRRRSTSWSLRARSWARARARISRRSRARSAARATASGPQKRSRAASCVRDEISARCSPWPENRTRWPRSAATAARGATAPSISDRARPSAGMRRATMNSWASSTSSRSGAAASSSSRSLQNSCGTRKVAWTSACRCPGRTTPASAAAPPSRASALVRTVLPAPVSPVITVSPRPNSSSACSITTSP